MNISIPEDVQEAISLRATKLGLKPDDLVHQALRWYLAMDDGVLEELDDWQRVRDEALELVERPEV